jgi:hypothetical protein
MQTSVCVSAKTGRHPTAGYAALMFSTSATEKPVSAEPYGIALVIWLILQMCALAISAGRVMLWSHSPRAGEQIALADMLAAQIIAASVLLPLLRGRRTVLILIVTAWPMAQLASFLADVPTHRLLVGETYVCIWLIIVHVWSRLISSPPGRLYASAIAMLLSLGGAVLCYLSIDFAEEAPQHMVSLPANAFGPIMGVIAQVVPDQALWAQGRWISWCALALLLFAGIVASGFELVIRRARRYGR